MKWKPDWYWLGMVILVQTLVIVTALAIYDCSKRPQTNISEPRR